MKIQSNRDRIVVYNSIYSYTDLDSSYRPKMGLAAARMEHREFNLVVMPAFAIEIVYYSIASCIATRSSDRILSNSSMQQTPPLASTNAPASNVNDDEFGRWRILAVSPAALLPLPEV
jgi:hypothetical protein